MSFNNKRRMLMAKAQSQVDIITISRRGSELKEENPGMITDPINCYDDDNTTYGTFSISANSGKTFSFKFNFSSIPANANIKNLQVYFKFNTHGRISCRFCKNLTTLSSWEDLGNGLIQPCTDTTYTGAIQEVTLDSINYTNNNATTINTTIQALNNDISILRNNNFYLRAYCHSNEIAYNTKIYDIEMTLTYEIPKRKILSYNSETTVYKPAIAVSNTSSWSNITNCYGATNGVNGNTWASRSSGTVATTLFFHYDFSDIPENAIITEMEVKIGYDAAGIIGYRIFRDYYDKENYISISSAAKTIKSTTATALDDSITSFNSTSVEVQALNNMPEIYKTSKRFGVRVYFGTRNSTSYRQKISGCIVKLTYKTINYS